MFALLRKYPIAIFASLLLHVAIVVALVVQVRSAPRQIQTASDEVGAPIQAVAISEDQILAEIERLDAEEQELDAQAAAEQKQREDTLAALDKARDEAEEADLIHTQSFLSRIHPPNR